jgi:hypothetical protein
MPSVDASSFGFVAGPASSSIWPTARVLMHVDASRGPRFFGKDQKLHLPRRVGIREGLFSSEPNMVDDVPLRTAVHTVWSLYLAKHRDVDAADSRRCLLERHLQGRWEARVSDAEELTGFGLAYLERLPEDEC